MESMYPPLCPARLTVETVEVVYCLAVARVGRGNQLVSVAEGGRCLLLGTSGESTITIEYINIDTLRRVAEHGLVLTSATVSVSGYLATGELFRFFSEAVGYPHPTLHQSSALRE
jgi:hypothetical protein